MSSFRHLQHSPCCIVLDVLQFVDDSHRSSVKHRVAVVKPAQDETAVCASLVVSRCHSQKK